MSNQGIFKPPLLPSPEALRDIPIRSLESREQEVMSGEQSERKDKKKKSSDAEHIREGLRKKRRKASFEYSKNIVEFDKLNVIQQKILRIVIDPKRIDARLPISKTEAEVREFYQIHHENHWKRLQDALWLVTFGALFGTEKAIQKNLRHIGREYEIDVLYYPGSGYDVIPRDALGADRVIHLSLEEHDSYYRMKHANDALSGYEKHDMELVGDFRSSPLKDASIRAILVKGIPTHSALEAQVDFKRVLKDDGVLLFVHDRSMIGADLLQKSIQKEFIKIGSRGCIEIYQKRNG